MSQLWRISSVIFPRPCWQRTSVVSAKTMRCRTHKESGNSNHFLRKAHAIMACLSSVSRQEHSTGCQVAVDQNQWYHFGVGAPPILVYVSRDWDPWPSRPCATQIARNSWMRSAKRLQRNLAWKFSVDLGVDQYSV